MTLVMQSVWCLSVLAGDPPRRIAQELRDLLGTMDFERTLHRKGIKLDGNEVQMALAGESVGKGVIAGDLMHVPCCLLVTVWLSFSATPSAITF